MSREYIITMTAQNRVGILAAVTNAMAELGAELHEASQTVVRDYFTMIFAAEFPDGHEERVIHDHLHDVCRPFGIEVSLTPRVPGTGQSASDVAMQRLRLRGRDVPGILRKIAATMSVNGVDIAGMHAWREEGEGEGEFEMVMKLAVPDTVDVAAIVDDLRTGQPEWQLVAELDHYAPGSAFTDDK